MFDVSREQQVKEIIQKILSSHEFDHTTNETSFLKVIAGWLRECFGWIKEQFNKVKLPSNKLNPSGELNAETAVTLKIIGMLLIIALLFLLVFFIIKISRSSRRVKQKKDAQLLSVLKDPQLIEQKALEFCQKGDFNQGLRFLYITLLLQFNEMNIIKIDKSKTNKQYLNEIRNIGYQHLDIVSQFTDDFNTYWYGNKSVSKEKFDSWYDMYTFLVKEGKQ